MPGPIAAQSRGTGGTSRVRRSENLVPPTPGRIPSSGEDHTIRTFRCEACGEEHDLGELSFGADAPLQWELITGEERARSTLGTDLCVIETAEGKHRFIRGCLDIPIQGSERSYTWGVWASLSEKSFDEVEEHWDDPERIRLGPYFGWLSTRIPEYPDTLYLKTHVHQRPLGLRPLITLEATEHPLAVHQRDGIPPDTLREMMLRLLHPPT
jgi:hypothetical protein